jgi:hypothetical protein
MSTAEIIPLIHSLQHIEKLHLIDFLVGEVLQENEDNLKENEIEKHHQIDALALIANIAQPLGAIDLARNFDNYTNKVLWNDFRE